MYPDFIRINHEWWRIITAGFLHFGAVHLVNNMVILYCMGSRLERVTGHLKYFLIYLVSLIGAGLLSYGMMALALALIAWCGLRFRRMANKV